MSDRTDEPRQQTPRAAFPPRVTKKQRRAYWRPIILVGLPTFLVLRFLIIGPLVADDEPPTRPDPVHDRVEHGIANAYLSIRALDEAREGLELPEVTLESFVDENRDRWASARDDLDADDIEVTVVRDDVVELRWPARDASDPPEVMCLDDSGPEPVTERSPCR